MKQVEIHVKILFRKLWKKTLSNSSDGNGAWKAEREQRQSPTLVWKSPVSLKKVQKAAGVWVKKQRSEIWVFPCLQSAPLMNGSTPAPLRKTHNPMHTHKTLLNTHTRGVHTHTQFSQELSRVEVLRGRAGRNNGLNSRGEREREREREGGVEERRERWDMGGGEWKGAGTCTVLFSTCAHACVCASLYLHWYPDKSFYSLQSIMWSVTLINRLLRLSPQ